MFLGSSDMYMHTLTWFEVSVFPQKDFSGFGDEYIESEVYINPV